MNSNFKNNNKNSKYNVQKILDKHYKSIISKDNRYKKYINN